MVDELYSLILAKATITISTVFADAQIEPEQRQDTRNSI